ncbi:MAG: carbohydrate porin [Gammaproteobacteria bacterium]
MKLLRAAALSLVPVATEGLVVAEDVGADADADRPSWDIEAYYAGDLWQNLDGGIERGGAYLDSLDVIVTWDGERAVGVKGLSAQALVLWNNGGSINMKVGDSFGVSNIETVEALRLFEAWVQYAPQHPERSLRLGLYDLNIEFDATDTGGVFLNSTFGMGIDFAQSGEAGPSAFPLTSLAVRGQWRFDERWRVQGVLADGVPGDPERPERTSVKLSSDDGLLGVVEIEHNEGGRRWVLGHWRYSARFDELAATLPDGSPRRSRGNEGSYAFVETPLTGPLAAGREASAVLRVGRADPRFNSFRDSLQLALAWQGGLLGREGEVFGVAVAHARHGEEARAAGASAGEPLRRDETVFEITWKFPVAPRLTLQPDLQYIVHPGSVPGRRDALVAGVRFDWRLDAP